MQQTKAYCAIEGMMKGVVKLNGGSI